MLTILRVALMAHVVNRESTLIELKKVGPELVEQLGHFFERNSADPYFHPHPLTFCEAARICTYIGPDIYIVAVAQDVVLAYGMLRGWEEGYPVPSLGIIIAPEARRTGLALLVMQYLHHNARLRGASMIRLKVYPANVAAVSLYRKIGYRFDSSADDGQLIGFFDLDPRI